MTDDSGGVRLETGPVGPKITGSDGAASVPVGLSHGGHGRRPGASGGRARPPECAPAPSGEDRPDRLSGHATATEEDPTPPPQISSGPLVTEKTVPDRPRTGQGARRLPPVDP